MSKRKGKKITGKTPGEAVAVQIQVLLDNVFTTDQAAEYLGLSEESARRYCSRGVFQHAHRLRKEWLIPRHDVYEYQRNRLGRVGRPSGKVSN